MIDFLILFETKYSEFSIVRETFLETPYRQRKKQVTQEKRGNTNKLCQFVDEHDHSSFLCLFTRYSTCCERKRNMWTFDLFRHEGEPVHVHLVRVDPPRVPDRLVERLPFIPHNARHELLIELLVICRRYTSARRAPLQHVIDDGLVLLDEQRARAVAQPPDAARGSICIEGIRSLELHLLFENESVSVAYKHFVVLLL